MQDTWVQSLGQEDPLKKEMATHSIILPGEFHGQRSLAGYSPWGAGRGLTKSQTWLSNLTTVTACDDSHPGVDWNGEVKHVPGAIDEEVTGAGQLAGVWVRSELRSYTRGDVWLMRHQQTRSGESWRRSGRRAGYHRIHAAVFCHEALWGHPCGDWSCPFWESNTDLSPVSQSVLHRADSLSTLLGWFVRQYLSLHTWVSNLEMSLQDRTLHLPIVWWPKKD